MFVYLSDEVERQDSYTLEAEHYLMYNRGRIDLKLEVILKEDKTGETLDEVIFSETESLEIDNYSLVDGSSWTLRGDRSFDSFGELYEHLKREYIYSNAKLITLDLRQSSKLSWDKSVKNEGNRARALVSVESSALTFEDTSPTITAMILNTSEDDQIKDGIRFQTSWICCFCGKEEEKLKLLIEHSLMNCEEIDSYSAKISTHSHLCLICGRRFLDLRELKDHLAMDHRETSSFFPCIACKIHFYSLNEFRKHVDLHHKEGSSESSLECEDCSKRFVNRSKLNRHRKTVHSDQRPYACSRCDETFKVMEKLTRHLKIHDQDSMIFQCKICNGKGGKEKSFRTLSNLKQHLITHKKRKGGPKTRKVEKTSCSVVVPKPVCVSNKKQEVVEINGSQFEIVYPNVEDLSSKEQAEVKSREVSSSSVIKRVPFFITEVNSVD